MQYPRSPKTLLGGMAHLGRLFDKIRMRQKGLIQDYNYLTAGFDKSLLDLLQLDGPMVEARVRQGGTDQELLAWIQSTARPLTNDEIHHWNERIITGRPQDEVAKIRYHRGLEEIADKRGVSVGSLPPISTWADAIDLDEERL